MGAEERRGERVRASLAKRARSKTSLASLLHRRCGAVPKPSFNRSFLRIPGACALRRHPRCRKIRRSRISRCGRSRSSSRALTRPEGAYLSHWRRSFLEEMVISGYSNAFLVTIRHLALFFVICTLFVHLLTHACRAGTSMISLIIPPKVRSEFIMHDEYDSLDAAVSKWTTRSEIGISAIVANGG